MTFKPDVPKCTCKTERSYLMLIWGRHYEGCAIIRKWPGVGVPPMILMALILLPGWVCAPKTPDNPQGLPRTVTVRYEPGYGVTQRLDATHAMGPPFEVRLVYIYKCGYAGLYRGPEGTCFSATGRAVKPTSCLDNGGRYAGAGVDPEGVCHESWQPQIQPDYLPGYLK